MKKIFALILVAVLASTFAFAAGGTFNPVVSQNAQFTGTVIAPLKWVEPEAGQTTLILPVGVAGQLRTTGFENSFVEFELNGEKDKGVTLTTHVSADPPEVTLGYAWSLTGDQTLDASGELVTKFKVNSIDAISTAHGTYTWTVSVDAIYRGI